MEQALTVKEAGVEGVVLAFQDSMQAAKMSREVKTLEEKLAESNLRNRQLLAELDRKDGIIKLRDREISCLKKANRAYRRQHMAAYEKYLCRQREGDNDKIARMTKYLIAFTIGMVSIIALTMMAMILL
ncbi:MAG: hypothetical protein IKO07_06265 [Clostridia bacterium]|nr:hypothetical protein [Clostridia bacterium]